MFNIGTMNGVVISSGSNVIIRNGKVIVDGKDITPNDKIITISIQGDVDSLTVDSCETCTITGNATTVKTMSGSVSVSGEVKGSISTMSGDVRCGNVGGSVSSMSGNIK